MRAHTLTTVALRMALAPVLLALPLTLLLALAPATALAQTSSMWQSLYTTTGTFTPAISRSDIDLIVRVLELNADEAALLRELYDNYAQTLIDEGQTVRIFCDRAIEEAELMGDQTLLAPANTRIRDWTTRKEKLEEQFLEDLSLMLTREQSERWPLVERELRRIKTISRGVMNGEGVDLLRLSFNELGRDVVEQAALIDILETYANDLDRALIRRNTALDSNVGANNWSLEQNKTLQEAIDDWKSMREKRTAVRDVNLRTLRRIVAQLEGANLTDEALTFELAFYDRAFGSEFKPTKMEERLEAALKLTDVSAEQKASLRALAREHRLERRSFIRRAADVYFERDATQIPSEWQRKLDGVTDDEFHAQGERLGLRLDDDHPLTRIRRDRVRHEHQLRDRLIDILGRDRVLALPVTSAGNAVFSNDSRWQQY